MPVKSLNAPVSKLTELFVVVEDELNVLSLAPSDGNVTFKVKVILLLAWERLHCCDKPADPDATD